MIDLPEIIHTNRFTNERDLLTHAQNIFIHDFIEYPPELNHTRVLTRTDKTKNGYYRTFWHIVTEGDHTENDKVDLNRLEKLQWINPIIDGQPDSDWWIWETKRKKDDRILIYSKKYRYLIVIDKRKDNVVFWTAYPITYDHVERKLEKEYLQYKAKSPTTIK